VQFGIGDSGFGVEIVVAVKSSVEKTVVEVDRDGR
jgi:hypothetical protein